ncbi:hypothetical protein AZF37_06805 [endosymbiont 'TC1' of Trimyema compressum]|uniref:hypothetical protein n=1 Tax=endosymbiont 'TC1' of Trimyema compressum TaxID=243899 RepID=UPI0007F12F07|nr:hypothetical protein [endosymbiont 'TC1' of Trimyema compressum]AMP20911.1 hypothetical protein AZF37_06805 [endosymbiont 'TC1' of Trimyema compressum]
MVLANIGSDVALEMILDFAASNEGRILKRELFGEAIGLMLGHKSCLETVLKRKISADESH